VSAPAYEADAGDRIVAVRAREKVSTRKRLDAAARLAGQQLELFMPGIIGHDSHGRLIARKFTAVAPGTVLFILAGEQRVATVHAPDQHDLVEQVVGLAGELRQFIWENGSGPAHWASASVIDLFLHEYGGNPGAATKPAPARAAVNTIRTLFAALTDDQVRLTLGNAREIARHGFCSAFVALLGPGVKSGTSAGCWQLLLHLAPPSVDAALLDATEEGGHA
jgi:hypothetical protein